MVVSSPQCGENTDFFSVFPLFWGEPRIKHFVSQRRTRRRSVRREPRIRHFVGYPFGASRKKASAIFYNTAKRTTKMKPSPPQYPQSWSLSAKRGKSLYFHYIAAIKQSHTMTGPKIETAYSNQSSGNIYRLYGRTIKKRLPLQRKAVFHPNALTRGIR